MSNAFSSPGRSEQNANAAATGGDPRGRRRGLRDGVYAEANHSADDLARSLKKLLPAFGVSPGELTIYLRQDRDAGRDEVA